MQADAQWGRRQTDEALQERLIPFCHTLRVDRLSRAQILAAFEALARELPASTLPAEIFVVGGAALVALYDARPVTKDVDAVFTGAVPAADVRAAAARVAVELGLPDNWLNDGAKGFVRGLAPGAVLVSTPTLIVRAVAPHQLLAMKLSAWRDDTDIGDARLLLSKVAGDREHVWAMVEPHLTPGRELRARYAFDDLWEAEHGPA